MALAGIIALGAASAPAARAGEEEGGKVTISGSLDWYYQYSFNHPPRNPGGAEVGGRAFDIKNDQFALSLVEINVNRTPSKAFPVGLTLTGTVGKTADLVHATEPGTKTVRFLQQLYGTYTTTGGTPVTIDVGKFVTHHGFEVIESATNWNYSGSLLFTWAIPFYHMGIRLSAPLSSQLTAGVHFVNGWNNVEDDNSGKSIGAQLNWKPTSALNLILNYMGGDEFTGAALPANLNTHLFDLAAVWSLNDRLKLGFNADYATAAKTGVGGGNWSGQAFYARYQLSASQALALRLEHFEDSDGLRTGVAQNLNEITATWEHVWRQNLITRLEFRHDHAGTAWFPSGSGGKRSQETLTLSQVVKF